ncbi:MAG: DUF559 domain-containing protein [Nostoc sp.]|uniref:DUF559 domain-containing protein n=1 Tax=Nostoc sp. TaxID=1180 RepID=UPI002FF4B73D
MPALVVQIKCATAYTQKEDAIRQEFLESLGLQVVRFRNEDVLERMEGVLQDISAWLQR